MNNFMVVLDKSLAEKLKNQGLILLHEKKISGQIGYVFSTKGQKLNFDLEDKNKVLFTNKLTF